MSLRRVLLAALLASACGGEEAPAEVPPKEAWEQAIAELREPVGEISAFAAYLALPEPKKYDPKQRSDLIRAGLYAADEIRHAANYARQKVKSGPGKDLRPALVELTRGCTGEEDEEQLAKCRGAVAAFDKALADAATKAGAAGASGTLARVLPGSVTDGAKKAVAPFAQAIGPGPIEQRYVAARPKEDISADQLIQDCDAAHGEAKGVWTALEKAEEPLRKVAAVHMLALEAQCNRLKSTQSGYKGLEACRQDPDKPKKQLSEEEEAECRVVCSNAQGIVNEGVPAGAFVPLVKLHDETCKQRK